MAKGKTVGAAIIVLFGMLFKPLGMLSPRIVPPKTVETNGSPGDSLAADGEGPWVASCRYWAPARDEQRHPDGHASTALPLHETATAKTEEPCNGSDNRWGIPRSRAAAYVHPNITAIVAAVPNPLHSRLSLQFDRTIDALLEAAADNGYVQSYYWLPWAVPKDRTEHDSSSQRGLAIKEGQPGLIILKQACTPQRNILPDNDLAPACDPRASSYGRVVYLFIVGNTPVEGMDGYQLNRAFQYERELQGESTPDSPVSVNFSFKGDRKNEFDLIGSEASGSAASMRAAIDHAFRNQKPDLFIRVAGATSTPIATDVFGGKSDLSYLSFADDVCSETKSLIKKTSPSAKPIAFLIEDGTAFGKGGCGDSQVMTFRYPLGISMLRNAQTEDGAASSERIPSPYIPFSLRDSIPDDTVLRFSILQTPLSQQAQLIEISRELRQNRVRSVVIQSSSPLDRIFLANFIYRTVPDVRLIFLGGGDLLQENGTSNLPLVGALNLTPFAPITPVHTATDSSLRVFPDHNSESVYNAAAYTFWDGQGLPKLANYTGISDSETVIHTSLWATVIGRDGTYPLRIIDQCAGHSEDVLPAFRLSDGNGVSEACSEPSNHDLVSYPRFAAVVHPTWFAFCALVSFLSVLRILLLSRASFHSPLGREVAISSNDEPRRRALYLCVGTLALFCGAFLLCSPLCLVQPSIDTGGASRWTAFITILSGSAQLVYTILKTSRYLLPRRDAHTSFPNPSLIDPDSDDDSDADDSHWYRIIYVIALLAAAVLIALWAGYCTRGAGSRDYRGLFFSYRSLNLVSGVSPLTPFLLLLTGWYLWSIIQNRRLRFSLRNKPALPQRTGDSAGDLLFVAEDDLAECPRSEDTPLFRIMTGLLLTREMLKRRWPKDKSWVLDCCLGICYLGILLACIKFASFTTLEDIFAGAMLSYGRSLQILFIALMLIGLSGWLRASMTWREFCRRVLWPLEESPLRMAFTRMSDVNWMLMMRQNGWVQRWREAARSAESMRQLLILPEIRSAIGLSTGTGSGGWSAQDYPGYAALVRHTLAARFFGESEPATLNDLARLGVVTNEKYTPTRNSDNSNQLWEASIREIEAKPENKMAVARFLSSRDIPGRANRGELLLMYLVENEYGVFATTLLRNVLIPFWKDKRVGFVQSQETKSQALKDRPPLEPNAEGLPAQLETDQVEDEPLYIRLAEEFVAIRYVSMIRAVLINIRHLMLFMSVAFVCVIVAWNSYPFRPRVGVDGALTVVLLLIAGGTVWIFSQMYRDPVLSRITGTQANELGSDFYLRVISSGAIPVLTWLAYHFPSISNTILKYLQPGLSGMK
jgi:hypothetical protein